MHHSLEPRAAARVYLAHYAEPEHFYAGLLQAHERACTAGQPLLTEAGLRFIRKELVQHRNGCDVREGLRSDAAAGGGRMLLPFWDAERRQLWLGAQLLKEFRQPAPNQTTLLDV